MKGLCAVAILNNVGKTAIAAVAATAVSLSVVPSAAAAELPDGVSVPPVAGAEAVPTYPTPVHHPGAPVPQPFSPDYVGGYISDISSYDYGVYWQPINGFEDLRANHPEVMQENLDRVVQINNEAKNNPAQIQRAQNDAMADKDGVLKAFSDALGSELGGYFLDALNENRLPKTTFLLGGGYTARAGGLASSTFAEKEYFGYERPFVVAPDRINRYESPQRDLYGTSKSFPSGHTNQATWATTLLTMALPERGPQILDRGAEAGYNRMVLGVHYPLDVIGGRITGTAAAADRWNDLKMRDAIRQAGDEIRAELQWRAGRPLADVIATDTPYRTTSQAVAEYTQRMTHGLKPVYNQNAPMIVPQAAPDLLLPKFPNLTYNQRAEVLRQTALPAGYPLDKQGPEGSWQRINLAAAYAATVDVAADGSVTVH